jgi:molybdenum cofactor synthesis domain-containing protein
MKKASLSNKISLEKALKIVLKSTKVMGEEEINFFEAQSRVLSRDVISEMDNPPFDRAMMDGYAIISTDTSYASSSKPVSLRLIGGVAIGEFPTITLSRGECVKIMTGAPVPKGADAVLRVEYSNQKDGNVQVSQPIPPGKDISNRGEDIMTGDVLLKKGRVLKPTDQGVLAATGNLKVWVKKKPEVMIVSTGSELVVPGQKLKPGSIYDINSYTLSSLTNEIGALPITHEIIRDDETALEDLLQSKWDVLLISGATSVGEKDFVPKVVERSGEVLFHGVNIRPGSPVGFGLVNQRPVFMLPGFPVSSIATFEHLVAPFIQKMLGLGITPRHNSVMASLQKTILSVKGRVDFVRARVEETGAQLTVKPIASKGSGLITTLSKADGYVLVPSERDSIEVGEKIKVYLF